MIVREIIQTCSNPHVARAAVLSIGGDFAARFSRDAATRNLSSGILAATLVREFAHHAGDGDWEGLDDATRGADMPILSGLRHILERETKIKGEDASAMFSAPPASILWRRQDLGCA